MRRSSTKLSRKAIERVRDMIEAMDKIAFLVDRFNFDKIAENFFYLDSLIRNLEIIGEASHHIPGSFKKNYPKIPWRQMKDVRNILVHEYYKVDLKIVYNIAKNRLPKLKRILVKILNDIEKMKD